MSATKATIECDISLHECERLAREMGGNTWFMAEFPAGTYRCDWLDVYMRLVRVHAPELRDGFMMVEQLDEMFPELKCSRPVNE